MTKALVIVDMLNDFILPDGALYCGPTASAIVGPVKELLEQARANKNLIIYLCDAHKENDLEFNRFPKHCVKDTPGAQIIDELTPDTQTNRELLVRKTRYSGFYGTILGYILEANKVEEAIVCGVCTSICVHDTVGGLANRDIKVKIVENAVADFDQNNHTNALVRMKTLYGAEII